jgi:hypothetical protein
MNLVANVSVSRVIGRHRSLVFNKDITQLIRELVKALKV